MRRGALWYISEEDLFAQAPVAVLRERQGGVDVIDFDLDLGAADEVAACEVQARADSWGILPGEVVTVAGCGPADGNYLVASVKVDLLDPSGQITVSIRKPVPPLPEPASEQAQRPSDGKDDDASGDAGGHVDKVYAAALHISGQHRPYVYGGGHKAFSAISPSEGLDCSSSTALALKRGGLYDGTAPMVSGDFARLWGQPGKGKYLTVWANRDHVWIEFDLPGKRGKRFDTSPQGGETQRGPHVRYNGRGTNGFTPRHWPGT